MLDEVLSTPLQNSAAVVHLAVSQASTITPRYTRLGISESMAMQFSTVLNTFLGRYAKLRARGGLELIAYDASQRPESDHVVEWLYLPAYRNLSAQVSALTEDQTSRVAPRDMRDKRFVSSLRFYSATVRPWLSPEKQIVAYRMYNASKVLGNSLFGVVWTGRDQEYDRLQESAFLFDLEFDCVQLGDHLFIFHQYNFHTIFRMEELIRPVAEETLQRIRKRIPILGFEDFMRDCQKPLSKLLKLRNIGLQDYLDEITIDDLERTIREREDLQVEIVDVEGERGLRYDPARPWDLLNLLSDDHLFSSMTNRNYLSREKSFVSKRKSASHA